MKKITIIKVFLIFSLIFIMTNCATEEIGRENTDTVTIAKEWFDNHKLDYNETVLKFVEELQWENAIVSNGEQGQVIEVPFKLQDNLSASNKTARVNDHHRLMFMKGSNGEFKLYNIQIFTDNENYYLLDKNFNYYTITDDFDGQVYVQELDTKKGNKFDFKEGKIIKPTPTSKPREPAITCVYYGYWYESGYFEPLYVVGCYGAGEGEQRDDPGLAYGGGTNEKTLGEGENESCPAGYRYRLGECVLDYRILTDASFINNPCLKSVYDKLKGSQTFQNYLKKFDGKFSVANLKLAASNTMPSNINADTSPPQNYLIQITLNSNNLNRPGLDIARTFLHEMIHAEMFRVLLSLSSSNGEIDVATLNNMLNQHNYPGMYDYYTRFGINGMQHEQMAAHYQGIMVSFLKDYDSTLTAAEYEAIAWEGLKGTTSWNSKSSQERQNITNTYNSWKSKAGNNCN